MPIFNYEDIEINYIKRGRGDPLLLFQGWGTTIEGWSLQLPYFKRRMQVIALDNRGVGGSSRPNYPYTMDMFVQEAKALLDFLNIKGKIHIMGVSMGGATAQNFVLKYPNMVKTVILLATSAFFDKQLHDNLYEQYRIIMEDLDIDEGFKRKLDLMFSDSFINNLNLDKKLYDLLKDILMTKNTTRLQDLINRGAAIEEHDTRDLLHKIKQPTLIIHGTADKMVPFENSKLLHEKIPNSKFITLEGYGHGSVLAEDAERINKIIWNFIQEHLD